MLFDEKLLVLEGNELPELFVIWKIAFMNRIYNHPSLSWDSKIKILNLYVLQWSTYSSQQYTREM